MMENGLKIKYKEKGNLLVRMEISTRVIGSMIKEKDMAIIFGMIKMSIKDNGRTINVKEKVLI